MSWVFESALTNLEGFHYSCSQSSTSALHRWPMMSTSLTFNNHQAQLQMNKLLGNVWSRRRASVARRAAMKLLSSVNDHSRTLTMSTQCILVFMMIMGPERLSWTPTTHTIMAQTVPKTAQACLESHSHWQLSVPILFSGSGCWWLVHLRNVPQALFSLESSDANFTSQTLEFAFAFWIPKNNNECWAGSKHYVAPDNFQFESLTLVTSGSTSTASTTSFLLCGWSLQWPTYGHSSFSTDQVARYRVYISTHRHTEVRSPSKQVYPILHT